MEVSHRLSICLLISTFIVGGLLMLVRMPDVAMLVAMPEITVNLLETENDLAEPLARAPGPDDPVSRPAAEETEEIAAAAEVISREAVDWGAEIAVVVSKMSPPSSQPAGFNVAQMEKRRRAAERFAPIPSNEPAPTWDNVVRDMTGRSVLVHGDCERVIDDPNVGSRDAFEVFGQYIISCKHYDEKPRVLAWVDEIKSRRAGPSRYGRPTAE